MTVQAALRAELRDVAEQAQYATLRLGVVRGSGFAG